MSALPLPRSVWTVIWPWVGRAGSSPDHGEEDGTAADKIHQEEDLLPESIVAGALLAGLDDDVGHVGQDLSGRGGWVDAPHASRHAHPSAHLEPKRHLQRDHDPEDVLLLVRQDVLDKGPA